MVNEQSVVAMCTHARTSLPITKHTSTRNITTRMDLVRVFSISTTNPASEKTIKNKTITRIVKIIMITSNEYTRAVFRMSWLNSHCYAHHSQRSKHFQFFKM